MTTEPTFDILFELNRLRENIQSFMKPEVLKSFADLMEALGGDEGVVNRYQYFVEHSVDGPDCKYAIRAKELFLNNNADNVAKSIKWLYENWAKHV